MMLIYPFLGSCDVVKFTWCHIWYHVKEHDVTWPKKWVKQYHTWHHMWFHIWCHNCMYTRAKLYDIICESYIAFYVTYDIIKLLWHNAMISKYDMIPPIYEIIGWGYDITLMKSYIWCYDIIHDRYKTSDPIIHWFLSKLAAWIGDYYGQERGIPLNGSEPMQNNRRTFSEISF
jgi:hypothetical protein